MIQMVSGGRTFAPKPVDGVVFLFEPLRTLASAIVDYHEGIGAPAPARGRSTRWRCCCCSPRSCCRSAAISSSCRCASTRHADEHVRPHARARRGPAGRRPAAAAGAPRPDAGAGAIGWCSPARGPRGLGLCLIAAAIVIYMGFRGIQYLRPGLLFSRPQVSTSQAGSGGFLDPLIGTAAADRDRHRARTAARGRAAPCGSPSTGGRAGWRAWSSRASRSSPGRPTS